MQGLALHKLKEDEFLLSTSAQAGISGDKTTFGYADYDGWLIKVNDSGSILWDISIGTYEFDFNFEIAGVLNNDDILLSTFSYSNASGAKTEDNYGELNYWLVKIENQNGDLIWDKTLGSGGSGETLGNVVVFEDKIYMLASSKSGISGLRNLPLKGIQDIWFVKLDDQGNIVHQNCFGGSSVESGVNIGQISNNEVISLVRSNSNSSIDKIEDSRGLSDLWFVKTDLNGNIIRQKTIGGSDNDYGIGLGNLPNGNYLICASSKSGISGEKTVPRIGPNSSDVWILEIDAVTLDIVNHHKVINESVLYPNPSTNQINISFSEPTKLKKAVLYDLSGQVVRELDLSQNFKASYVFNTQGLASGVYSIQLVGDGFSQTRKVVVE